MFPAPVRVAEAISNYAEPKNTVGRASKRSRENLRDTKSGIRPYSLQEEQQRELTEKKAKQSHLEFCLNEEKSKVLEDLIATPTVLPDQKVGSIGAFKTRSKLVRKDLVSVKPKLCTVPALQQHVSQVSVSSSEQSHIEKNISAEIKCINTQNIPAPCILMPTRLVPQSQVILCGRLAGSQTRSIGIQVDLQPISDIKIM